MRRIAAAVVFSVITCFFLAGCSGFLNSMQLGASAGLQSFFANQFSKKFLSAVELLTRELTVPGGFLNDPLVKILLPPPLGLVLGTAQALRENPQATLLQTLVNQAAENAIPMVGPIVSQAITNMDGQKLQAMLNGDEAAVTEYLKVEAGASLKAALLPEITRQLQVSGAVEIYDQLAKAQQQVASVNEAVAAQASGVVPPYQPVLSAVPVASAMAVTRSGQDNTDRAGTAQPGTKHVVSEQPDPEHVSTEQISTEPVSPEKVGAEQLLTEHQAIVADKPALVPSLSPAPAPTKKSKRKASAKTTATAVIAAVMLPDTASGALAVATPGIAPSATPVTPEAAALLPKPAKEAVAKPVEQAAPVANNASTDTVAPVVTLTPEQLGQYVVDMTVDGFFNKLAAKETAIRSNLGVMPGAAN